MIGVRISSGFVLPSFKKKGALGGISDETDGQPSTARGGGKSSTPATISTAVGACVCAGGCGTVRGLVFVLRRERESVGCSCSSSTRSGPCVLAGEAKNPGDP